MKTFHSIHAFTEDQQTVVTIGTFDGVHMGHKKVLDRLIQVAQLEQLKSVVLTFFPHPRTVLERGGVLKHLNTIEEKKDLLAQTGLDYLVIHPFDTPFSNLSASEFVAEYLVTVLKCKKIIIGHDHRFGKGRSADFTDLVQFGKEYGFEVEQIPVREIEDIAVSSTKIRQALEDGHIILANEYLGYRYGFTGKVIKGKQIGRTIGFPTANIQIDENYKLIPKNGVYIVSISWQEKQAYGMLNIGYNPTIGGATDVVKIEVHVLDTVVDLYDQTLNISFLKRLRDEKKFDSLEALKHQLKQDQLASTHYLQTFRQ